VKIFKEVKEYEIVEYLELSDLAKLWNLDKDRLKRSIQNIRARRPKERQFPQADRTGSHNAPLWRKKRLEELTEWAKMNGWIEMSGYGKDVKVAFFNAPNEARFKVLKVIELNGVNPEAKFQLIKWTTMSGPMMVGVAADKDSALAAFGKQIEKERTLEPHFILIHEA